MCTNVHRGPEVSVVPPMTAAEHKRPALSEARLRFEWNGLRKRDAPLHAAADPVVAVSDRVENVGIRSHMHAADGVHSV